GGLEVLSSAVAEKPINALKIAVAVVGRFDFITGTSRNPRRSKTNSARVWIFNRLSRCLFHALIRNQERQRERIGIKVGITGNTANAAGGTDLPIGPTIFGAGIDVVAATAAAVPRIAGVEVLTVIVSHPRRQIA